MKKLFTFLSIIIAVAISFHFISNHYRYSIHDWLIQFEASNANLKYKSNSVPKTHYFKQQVFTYLEGPKLKGQKNILMIHGFGSAKEDWLQYAGFLSSQYHIVAVDLLGSGGNRPDLTQKYSIKNQVEYVHQTTKVLGLEKFYLIG